MVLPVVDGVDGMWAIADLESKWQVAADAQHLRPLSMAMLLERQQWHLRDVTINVVVLEGIVGPIADEGFRGVGELWVKHDFTWLWHGSLASGDSRRPLLVAGVSALCHGGSSSDVARTGRSNPTGVPRNQRAQRHREETLGETA